MDAVVRRAVVEYMLANPKGVTVKDVERDVGTSELRKLVCILTNSGRYEVEKITEVGVNRFGRPVHYKRYILREI